MACVKPDGSLTATGLATLAKVAAEPGVPSLAVAKALGKPLFIARSILRELVEAGLATAEGEAVAGSPATALFRITDAGQAARKTGKVGS